MTDVSNGEDGEESGDDNEGDVDKADGESPGEGNNEADG